MQTLNKPIVGSYIFTQEMMVELHAATVGTKICHLACIPHAKLHAWKKETDLHICKILHTTRNTK